MGWRESNDKDYRTGQRSLVTAGKTESKGGLPGIFDLSFFIAILSAVILSWFFWGSNSDERLETEKRIADLQLRTTIAEAALAQLKSDLGEIDEVLSTHCETALTRSGYGSAKRLCEDLKSIEALNTEWVP